MYKLSIQHWDNDPAPLINDHGWPIKGFELRLKKATTLNKKEMKLTLKNISNKTIKELVLTCGNRSEALSIADLLVFHGATVKITES